MATTDTGTGNSTQRRRKLAVLLALLLACTALAIGGSVYFQHKREKAAAQAQASNKTKTAGEEGLGNAGALTAPRTALTDEGMAMGDEENKPGNTVQPPPKRRHTIQHGEKKTKGDRFAENVLTQQPTGAGNTGDTTADLGTQATPPAEVAGGTQTTPPSQGSGETATSPSTPDPVAPNPTTPTITDGTSAQVPVVSSVPEPSSWALLLAGLGLLGFRLRRRS